MHLEPLLTHERTLILESPTNRDEVLLAIAEHASRELPGTSADQLKEDLLEREKRFPTSTPEGVAFPHALLADINETLVIAAIIRPGVGFGVASHPPIDVVFAMFGDSAKPFNHVRLLARLARIARADGALERLRTSENAAVFYDRLIAEDRAHA